MSYSPVPESGSGVVKRYDLQRNLQVAGVVVRGFKS